MIRVKTSVKKPTSLLTQIEKGTINEKSFSLFIIFILDLYKNYQILYFCELLGIKYKPN